MVVRWSSRVLSSRDAGSGSGAILIPSINIRDLLAQPKSPSLRGRRSRSATAVPMPRVARSGRTCARRSGAKPEASRPDADLVIGGTTVPPGTTRFGHCRQKARGKLNRQGSEGEEVRNSRGRWERRKPTRKATRSAQSIRIGKSAVENLAWAVETWRALALGSRHSAFAPWPFGRRDPEQNKGRFADSTGCDESVRTPGTERRMPRPRCHMPVHQKTALRRLHDPAVAVV